MDVALSFREYGAGPPLIILHGLFGSSVNWVSMARRLSHERRVLCLDLRNHGHSPHTPDMSYADMVSDVRRFMDDHGLDRAAILGHSLGGKVAMGLALADPARIDRLIVVDIAPVTYRHSYAGIIHALRGLDLSEVTSRAQADSLLAPELPEVGLRQFLLQNLSGVNGGYRWCVNLEATERSEQEIKGFSTGPQTQPYAGQALFLRGALSDYVSSEHYPIIHRLFPAAHIEVIPGAGHWVHVDKPDGFFAALRSFLAPAQSENPSGRSS